MLLYKETKRNKKLLDWEDLDINHLSLGILETAA